MGDRLVLIWVGIKRRLRGLRNGMMSFERRDQSKWLGVVMVQTGLIISVSLVDEKLLGGRRISLDGGKGGQVFLLDPRRRVGWDISRLPIVLVVHDGVGAMTVQWV